MNIINGEKHGKTKTNRICKTATDKTKVKISLNVEALEECQKGETSTGEEYYSLNIDMDALLMVLTGRRAVTTIMSGNLENVVGEQ